MAMRRVENQDNGSVKIDKGFRRQLANLNNMIGQANLNLYGTDRQSEVDQLNSQFQTIMNNQMDSITKRDSDDITSFLGQIISNDRKTTATDELFNNQFLSMTGDDMGAMQSFIYDAYRSKILEQSDIHEVSSQLIELSEAILITRDAIISADVVEGRMSRTLKIDNVDEDDKEGAISIIETMEKKFKLLEKIKNFIVPKTLEFGEFYVYIIPYSKLFSDFDKAKSKMGGYGDRLYRESTVFESFDVDVRKSKETKKASELHREFYEWCDSVYESYTIQDKTRNSKATQKKISDTVSKDEFRKDMQNILEHVTVSPFELPLPVLEEGVGSIEMLKQHMIDQNVIYMERGESDEIEYKYVEKVSTFTESNLKPDNVFDTINDSKVDDSETFGTKSKEKKEKKEDFSSIKDCYVKMIDPMKMVPIKVMNTTIGYYYIQSEDVTPLAGAASNTLYFSKFDDHRKERTLVDAIAERIVKNFDKPFLEKNSKFKSLIVDALNYYNLNERKLKFQFIPVEYVQEFKIDEDMDGNGTSMIKKSLFYAKLYLMILLFKIMSIILNSNDTKVNYVKKSGIDKDIANKIQEIARIKQSRQININDLFSYTTIINKVGNGSEMYIPTGRSGERPIETEILSGQDIQLNGDLLEMLKNSYILGTGVPAAIVNYMQEADFAKVIEQNNTKFNGRVVNYQLDFNPNITSMYKMIMKWSTTLDDTVIDNFEFTLQPPKTTTINTKADLINQFNALADFLITLLFDDPNQNIENTDLLDEIKEFKRLLCEDQLPMIDMSMVEDLVEKARMAVKEKKLTPNPKNGDDGNDDGIDDVLDEI